MSITPTTFGGEYTYSYLGRGWVHGKGTQLKLELYRNGVVSGSPITPQGFTCADGDVGSITGLNPDYFDCDSTTYVCDPSSDPTYNNVLIFDLTE